MNLFKILTDVFIEETDVDKKSYIDEKQARAMSVVKRFSRGGVALQSGRILTQEKFDDELENLKKKISQNEDA